MINPLCSGGTYVLHPYISYILHLCPTFWQFVLIRATVLHFDDISVRNILHCQIHSRRSNLVEIFRGFRFKKLIKSLCHSLFCYTVIWMLRTIFNCAPRCLLWILITIHRTLTVECAKRNELQ